MRTVILLAQAVSYAHAHGKDQVMSDRDETIRVNVQRWKAGLMTAEDLMTAISWIEGCETV